MNIKRILSTLLAVLIVVSALSACASTGSAVSAGVDEEGRFVYRVVRAAKAETFAEDGAKAIRVAIKENFGYGVTMIKDSAISDYEGNLEILVGDTNRAQSANAKQILAENRPNNKYDFIVKVDGDKIVIQSLIPEVMESAVNWFVKTFCQNIDDWSMLKKDYQFIYEHKTVESEEDNTVNGVDLGLFTVVRPLKSSYLPSMYAEDYVSLYSALGYNVNVIEDIDAEVKNEILIGDTTRKESQSVTVEGDNYVIKVVDGDVVIKGGSDLATWRAVKEFYDLVYKITEGTVITWSDGFTINGKYDATENGAYTLNWYDEFEGSSIDFNKWGEFGTMAPQTETSGLGGFKCWQTPYGDSPYNEKPTANQLKKLIYQSGGNLHLATQRLNEIDFVGGQISTYNTMLFRYGVFEIRSKLPPEPCSLGYWCFGDALMVDKGEGRLANRFGGAQQFRSAACEIDIIENFGSSKNINTNVHVWWLDETGDGYQSNHISLDGNSLYTGKSKNNKKKEYDQTRYEGDLSSDYHYYGVYWTDNFMKFFFDGKTYLDYQYDAEVKGASAYCLMNYFITECQMGDISYGATYDPDEHGDYYEHIIDYVRIYQSDSLKSQIVYAWPQTQETGTLKYHYPEHGVNGDF